MSVFEFLIDLTQFHDTLGKLAKIAKKREGKSEKKRE